MTLPTTPSLYSMLYDMNNLNQTETPSPLSTKRRSIFTLSSSNGSSSPRPISTSTSAPGIELRHGQLNNLNITEQLTRALKTSQQDHPYSILKKSSATQNLEGNIQIDSSIPPTISTCSTSSKDSPAANFNCDNFSSEIPSSKSIVSTSSPISQQCDRISKLNQQLPLSARQVKVKSDTQDRLERHNSLDSLNRPKNPNSKPLRFSRRKKERKMEQKDEDPERNGGIITHISSTNCRSKITPAVISIEFCEDTSSHTQSSQLNLRKDTMMYRASTAFAMGAVRKLSLRVTKLTQESAARFILHSLLLNSWRQAKKQNEKLIKENSNHQRTAENMCLQLRVLRQMHREEKEKSGQIMEIKKERDKIQSELEKVENELNNCQVFVDNLRNQNMELIMTNNDLHNKIGELESEKNGEINRITQVEMAVMDYQQKVKELREQLQDMTRQKTKWQEEARGHESTVITLKTDLTMGDKKLIKAQNSYNELLREVKLFKEYKVTMQTESQRLKEELRESGDHIQTLTTNVQNSKDTLKTEQKKNQELQRLIDEKETQILETKRDLSVFLQACVEKRRRWADSFHYLIFPLDIFRHMFEGQRDKGNHHRVSHDSGNLVF